MADADQPAPQEGIVASTEFVRHRNVLLARARLSDLYLDYYLHLADCGMHVAEEHDRPFKDMIAAFVLHAVSRPRNELIAWTINLQAPRLNLFATADNELGHVIGRVFVENVKEGEHNLFFCETIRQVGGRYDPPRRSTVDFDGGDIFAAVEMFYARSEQRPGRFFDLGEENFVLLSAHPDCDLAWLRTVTLDEVRELATTETLAPIERRGYRWRCGCSEERIMKVLAPTMRQDPEGLFQGEDSIATQCPRCGVLYRISRHALEAWTAKHPPS